MNDEKKRALAEIEHIAREIATMLGLEIVEFVFRGQGRHSQLRIDIDRPGMPGVDLSDCERLSRELGDRIDDLPSFVAPYDLQVSSPGIDRPIRSDGDVRRNTGRPVHVEFRDENGKVRDLHGTLAGTEGNGIVRIASENGETRIPCAHIVLMKQNASLAGRRRGGA